MPWSPIILSSEASRDADWARLFWIIVTCRDREVLAKGHLGQHWKMGSGRDNITQGLLISLSMGGLRTGDSGYIEQGFILWQ